MNYDAELIIEVARMYYEAKLGQNEIARRVNLSRSTISRILMQAQEKGYVKITVVDLNKSTSDLGERLKETFDLKEALVVSNFRENARGVRSYLGKASAEYLVSVLKPNDVLGIAWGRTTLEIAKNMPDYHVDGISVVSITGCTYESTMDESLFDVARMFAKKLDAKLRLLYTPIIVSSVEVKNAYLSDSNTRKVMEDIKRSNIVLNGIGYFGRHSMIYRYGYITDKQLEELYRKGAVGNFASVYYDINGNMIDQDLSERTIGITFEALRSKEYSIGVAAGREKYGAILGAMRGRFINVLITDNETAKGLLSMQEKADKTKKPDSPH